MGAQQAKALARILSTLETEYGSIQPTDDPVEAGFLALLAEHAPEFSTDSVRDHLRMAFVDWNEMRVAEPWDIVVAMGAGGKPAARKFAKATGKYLRSLHGVLNRCSFDGLDPDSDPEPLVNKMRGVPATAKLVVLSIVKGGAAPSQDMSKFLQKHGIIPKTTSVNKAAKSLLGVCSSEELLRAHYLLGRYLTRPKDSADPLEGGSPRPAPAKAVVEAPAEEAPAEEAAAPAPAPEKAAKTAKKPAAKKAVKAKPAKTTASKKAAKSTAAKKPAKKAAKKTTTKKPAAKKAAKKSAKKSAR